MVNGTESNWLKTFNNQTHKLDSGWYAVKLPAAGNIPWAEAREQERQFFQSEEPWKSDIGGTDRARLGSEQLAQYISGLLSNLVAARLFLPVCRYRLTPIPDFHPYPKRSQT